MINRPKIEINIPFSWLECTPGLSPCSRFIWVHLNQLLECSTKGFIEGDVKTISARLNVSDRTFKKAVDELRAEKLLKRRKCKTTLGANSFRYVPLLAKEMFPHRSDSVIRVNEDTLRHPTLRPETKKLTVAQRLLLMIVRSFAAGLGIVTSLNAKKLSKLTGIREINIYGNLAKLAELKCISKISKHNTSIKRNPKTWIFIAKSRKRPTGYLLQINRTRFTEIARAWELQRDNTLPEPEISHQLDSNAIAMKSEEHNVFLQQWHEQPFPALNPKELENLKNYLNSHKSGLRAAINEIGLFYLDFLICFATLQIVSGNCWAHNYQWNGPKWRSAYFLALDLLTDFQLTSGAKNQIAEIIQSLSQITACSFERSVLGINDIDFTDARLVLFNSFSITIELDVLHNSALKTHTIVTQSEYYSDR